MRELTLTAMNTADEYTDRGRGIDGREKSLNPDASKQKSPMHRSIITKIPIIIPIMILILSKIFNIFIIYQINNYYRT